MTHIAVVRLAPGQCGFYDGLSKIHLTLMKKEAKVMQGVNTTGLIAAVRAGKIVVVSGSLSIGPTFYDNEPVEAIPSYYRLLKNKTVKTVKASEPVHEVKTQEIEVEIKPAAEEVAKEEIITEVTEVAVEETVTEEPVAEAPKKKTTRKKKAAATEETKED